MQEVRSVKGLADSVDQQLLPEQKHSLFSVQWLRMLRAGVLSRQLVTLFSVTVLVCSADSW
jgi:hypothetical protein